MSRAPKRRIFEEFKDRVYSLTLRYTNDPDAAADLTQEIFLKIFQSLRTFRGEAKLDTWIYRLAINTCIDHGRKAKRVLELSERVARDCGADPLETLENLELQTLVQRAVAELPDGTRESIVLRYVNGCSYDEIAEILGCPGGTVAARISRGRDLLRKKLEHLPCAAVALFLFSLRTPNVVDLGPYLRPVQASTGASGADSLASALPGLLPVAGRSPYDLPNYRLVRRYRHAALEQAVYERPGGGRIALFSAPMRVRFRYGQEVGLETQLDGIRCEKVDCPKQETYSFVAGRRRYVLVSKSCTPQEAAELMMSLGALRNK